MPRVSRQPHSFFWSVCPGMRLLVPQMKAEVNEEGGRLRHGHPPLPSLAWKTSVCGTLKGILLMKTQSQLDETRNAEGFFRVTL